MNAGISADSFSLKARRTSRIPLRIPVLLVVDDQGKSRSLDGWTMIVNVHGAKIECKRRFGMHEEVVVQVPSNGKSQKGKVVWSRSEPNENRNYEIGVELDRPENLWGVGFPASDWENAGRAKESGGSSAILDLAPKDAIMTAPVESRNSAVREAGRESSSAPAGAQSVGSEMYSSAPAQLSQALDLSEDVFSGDSRGQDAETGNGFITQPDSLGAPAVPSVSSQEDQTPMAVAETLETSSSLQQALVSGDFTDRLSSIVNELVDAALRAKLQALAAEVGAAALSRAEQRLEAAALAQSQSLEQHAIEFTAARQQTLEQNVQRFVETSEAEVRGRQEQFLGQSQSTLQTEIDQLVRYGRERMEQHSADLLFASQKGLRASMEQQLPAIEKNLMERCLKQSEALMAGQVEQWTLLHSDRMQQSQQAAEQRLNAVSEQVAGRQAAALEAKLAEIGTQSGARLEQQLERIGTQVRQAFLRHLVTELG